MGGGGGIIIGSLRYIFIYAFIYLTIYLFIYLSLYVFVIYSLPFLKVHYRKMLESGGKICICCVF